MNKIICDICGTTYPDSSECCPICGCTNAMAEDILKAELSSNDYLDDIGTNASAAGKKKEIFDYEEVNTPEPTEEEEVEEDDYDEEEEEEAPRHNTFVVILLTILIVVLLGAAAFLFVRYFLPNMRDEEIPSTTAAIQETEQAASTTEPTIPCQQMFMTNAGVAELSAEGQQFLLHIKTLPENTTDQIVYTSADETIATVTEDGKITAVSEGETVIHITCGEYFINCPVIVKYVEETVPPTTEETVPEETAPAETTPAETQSDAASEGTSNLKNITLKLKKSDIQLGIYYQFQLELDCALTPEEVTWSSEHPHIATVDEQGNVTAVKEGTTAITAKYGDQQVQCIVRCIWY